MKILVLAHRVPFPPNKGEKLRTYHQIEHLVQLGHKLTVFVPNTEPDDIAQADSLAKHLNISVKIYSTRHKIFRYLFGLLLNKSLSEAYFYSASLAKSLIKMIDGIDAIYCTASSLQPYLNNVDVNNIANTKKLIDLMDVDSDKWHQFSQAASFPMSWVYKREHRIIKRIEQACIQNFSKLFLIANTEEKVFLDKVAQTKKLAILGNGIDEQMFCPAKLGAKSKEPTFLFVGVMDYKPNIDTVLWFVDNCWQSIKQEIPEAKFVIAGMNPSKSILNLTNDKSITVTGFVDDIVPVFQSSHVFVAPFQIARGVQNKVLQAMSCALPVVTSKIGAEGIHYQADSDLLIAEESEAFIQHCVKLAEDTSLRESIGNNARETIIKNYSWPSVLKPLENALNTDA